MKKILAWALAPLTLLLSACPGTGDPALCEGLHSTFQIEDGTGQAASTFSAGEPITLRAEIRNETGSTKTLTVGGCGPVILEVRDLLDATIWTNFDDVACPAVVSEVTYAPGEEKSFVVQWDQKQRNGEQTPGGEYTAVLNDVTECSDALSKSAQFSIE
jgi:hypothetical protein